METIIIQWVIQGYRIWGMCGPHYNIYPKPYSIYLRGLYALNHENCPGLNFDAIPESASGEGFGCRV